MSDGEKNVWIAAGEGDFDCVKEYISSGVSVNAQDAFGYSPLTAAVSYNHIQIVEYLLSQRADINIRDMDGDTPLYAAETVEMAQLLLAHGADPTVKNAEGKTPAEVTFNEGWLDVAALLRSRTGETTPTTVSENENFDENDPNEAGADNDTNEEDNADGYHNVRGALR
ncbi:3433_t:CDS:2 [Paraglomus occultum]|uniref:3433_t:CDS:1 n=1 Tax=Paraglomus occultum TaxID=144539 RepID=A0A9N9F5K3_9GLOM|nr:3433_t:CDS:2 [Paraglomus occultum]